MGADRKQLIVTLLKGIETGDASAAEAVNEQRYIQHNPQTHEGSEGLATLFKRLSQTSPRVNIVRVFEDGDFVVAHTEYDFANRNIGFEVFRFEGDQAVEHWDNIQRRKGPNAAGHCMVDGPTGVSDRHLTEANRERVGAFVSAVLIGGELDRMGEFIDRGDFTQHNPAMTDDPASWRTALEAGANSDLQIRYTRNHRLLAEGNFVLAASEGTVNGKHSAIYDLFRLAENRLVEHWDTIETIPPRSEWKNDNGKF